MAFTDRMQIACPPSKAFDLMADARNELKWNHDVSAAELRTDEPVGLGSTFVVVNRGREDEATITRFDRPERLDFAVVSKQLDIDIRYTFEAAGGGTPGGRHLRCSTKGCNEDAPALTHAGDQAWSRETARQLRSAL